MVYEHAYLIIHASTVDNSSHEFSPWYKGFASIPPFLPLESSFDSWAGRQTGQTIDSHVTGSVDYVIASRLATQK